MVRIWQDLLGIGQIGVEDNFFELGGNSLTGLQLINCINKEFGATISALTLFECSTIAALSERLATPSRAVEAGTVTRPAGSGGSAAMRTG